MKHWSSRPGPSAALLPISGRSTAIAAYGDREWAVCRCACRHARQRLQAVVDELAAWSNSTYEQSSQAGRAVAEQERRFGAAEIQRARDEAVDQACDWWPPTLVAHRMRGPPSLARGSRATTAPRATTAALGGGPRDGNVKRVRGFTIPEALPRASSRPRCRASAIPRGRG